jgi:hypothetical protein
MTTHAMMKDASGLVIMYDIEDEDMKLTDEQCNEFRRLPLGFNDMVRAIYNAGADNAYERAAQACESEAMPFEDTGSEDHKSYDMIYNGAIRDAVKSIRALKTK